MTNLMSVGSGHSGFLFLRLRGRNVLPSLARALQLSTGTGRRAGDDEGGEWTDESPKGGLTDLYVYRPESGTRWPNSALGIFAQQTDPKFNLPGHVGINPGVPLIKATVKPEVATGGAYRSDLLARPTNIENQAQTLYSAEDFIQHTSGSDVVVCADVLDEFPAMSAGLYCEVHEAPQLLKRDLQPLFPDKDLLASSLSVITLAQKTEHDMSVWSDDMEDERDKLTEHFFTAAKEICARLRRDGHWVDFVDPSSGTPYFSAHTNTTLFETDEKYRLLGFRVEDLGCCKVLCHREFGRHVFVGTIFTDANPATGVMNDLFADLRIAVSKGEGN